MQKTCFLLFILSISLIKAAEDISFEGTQTVKEEALHFVNTMESQCNTLLKTTIVNALRLILLAADKTGESELIHKAIQDLISACKDVINDSTDPIGSKLKSIQYIFSNFAADIEYTKTAALIAHVFQDADLIPESLEEKALFRSIIGAMEIGCCQ